MTPRAQGEFPLIFSFFFFYHDLVLGPDTVMGRTQLSEELKPQISGWRTGKGEDLESVMWIAGKREFRH